MANNIYVNRPGQGPAKVTPPVQKTELQKRYESDKRKRGTKSIIFTIVVGVLLLFGIIQGIMLGSDIKEYSNPSTYSAESLLSNIQYENNLDFIQRKTTVNMYSGIPMEGDMGCLKAYADYADARLMHTIAERLNDTAKMEQADLLMEEASSRMGGLAVKTDSLDQLYGNKDIAAVYESEE